MSLGINVERPHVLWRQVGEQMRQKILSGELPAGSKLPTTQEIAAQTGTHVKTVHRALTDLVREGLITRVRRVGTYVTERNTLMSPIGIYHPRQIYADSRALFLQALNNELQAQAHASGLVTRIWVDNRPQEEQTTPLPELEEAARKREIQGLVSSIADPIHLEWLGKLRVPVAYSGSERPSSVQWDIFQFLDIALAHLKNRGIRTVGVIVPYRETFHLFFEKLRQKCREQNLILKNQHLIHACSEHTEKLKLNRKSDNSTEIFGYHAFNQLWSAAEKPQALIVYPDSVVRGVIMGLAQQQVSVPEDLELVLHKNEEIDLLCPFPATFVLSSARETAQALIGQLQTLYEGRPHSLIRLPFSLSESAPENANQIPP